MVVWRAAGYGDKDMVISSRVKELFGIQSGQDW